MIRVSNFIFNLVDDFDLFEKVLDYTFNKHLRCDPSIHPILMSEAVVCLFLSI